METNCTYTVYNTPTDDEAHAKFLGVILLDESKTVDSTIEVAVQICGKLKGTMNFASDADKDTMLSAVKADERFAKLIEGKTIVKEIVVPGRLINIVVK